MDEIFLLLFYFLKNPSIAVERKLKFMICFGISRKTIVWPRAALLAALFLPFVGPVSAQAAGRQQLHGHVPAEVATAPLAGDVPSNQVMHLTIGLPLRNQDALNDLIQQLYDPKSPQYHQYLKPDQFTERFGPTESDYQAVIHFAQSQGLSVTRTYSNRVLLEVSGTAGQVQNVFHVNLHFYQRSNGKKFYAPDQDPSVDLDIPLAHISGLDNSGLVRRNNVTVPKSPAGANRFSGLTPRVERSRPNSGTGWPIDEFFPGQPGYTYTGNDFRNVYLPCTSLTGTGQTVALFEMDNYYQTDVTNYSSYTGLAIPNISIITVPPGPPQTPSVAEDEVILDIDMVWSMAPAANILVYEGQNNQDYNDLEFVTNPDTVLNQIATDDLAQQISSSWSWSGLNDPMITSIFEEYATQGQSFFQASGDLGAYNISGSVEPDGPVSGGNIWQPTIMTSLMTVAGGTQLTTTGSNGTSAGTYVSETTWNDPLERPAPLPSVYNSVSGGGYASPSSDNPAGLPITFWQNGIAQANAEVSTTYRNIPDVAWLADDIFIYTSGYNYEGVFEEGQPTLEAGTSAAAPLWAGFAALVNQQALASGNRGTLGFANPYLYSLAGYPTAYTGNYFNDINDGSNNNYSGTGEYHAVTGYDLTTGLGSPKCDLIIVSEGSIPTFTPTPTNTSSSTPTFTSTPTPTPASCGLTMTSSFGSVGTGLGQFETPFDAAIDSNGLIYVADALDRITEWSSIPYSSPLTSWSLTGSGTYHLAVDSQYLYVSSEVGNTVQIFTIPSGGPVTTINLSASPWGIAVDGSGNIFVAVSDQILELKPPLYNSTVLIPHTGEAFLGIALDGLGNLYTGDGNGKVERYGTSGIAESVVTTEGTGTGQTGGPIFDLGVDPCNRLYVDDSTNERALVFSPQGAGYLTTVPFVSGSGSIYGIGLDKSGNLYVPSSNLEEVEVFSPLSCFACNIPTPTPTPSPTPTNSFTPSPTSTFTFTGSPTPTNTPTPTTSGTATNTATPLPTNCCQVVWSKPGGTGGNFSAPKGVAILGSYLYVADYYRVQWFQMDGTPVGSASTSISSIDAITTGPDGYLYGAELDGYVKVMDANANVILPVPVASDGLQGIYLDARGNVFVTGDSGNVYYLQRTNGFGGTPTFNPAVMLNLGTTLNNPYGLSVDGDFITGSTTLYVAATNSGEVLSFNQIGNSTTFNNMTVVTASGNGPGQTVGPSGITRDSSGTYYVSDNGDGRVEVFTPAFGYLRECAPGGNFPGIAVDTQGGIYLSGNTGGFDVLEKLGCAPTPTNTPTNSPTSTATLTPTPSSSPTNTSSPTPSPTVTSTFTNSPTRTPTNTPTMTSTPTLTSTYSPTSTSTSTLTITVTRTVTPTPTTTGSPTKTSTPTSTPTVTATRTVTPTPTQTGSPTKTGTPTATRTVTPTPSVTSTRTNTGTPTVTRTPTTTPSVTVTRTVTPTPSVTGTPTKTGTPTVTRTPTSTPSITVTRTVTPTPSVTSTRTNTGTPTITRTPTNTPTVTLTRTFTSTRTVTATRTVTPTPTVTSTPTMSGCGTLNMNTLSITSPVSGPGTVVGMSATVFQTNPACTQTYSADSIDFHITLAGNLGTQVQQVLLLQNGVLIGSANWSSGVTDTSFDFESTPLLMTVPGTFQLDYVLASSSASGTIQTVIPDSSGSTLWLTGVGFTTVGTPVTQILTVGTGDLVKNAIVILDNPTMTPTISPTPTGPSLSASVAPNVSTGGEPIRFQVTLEDPASIHLYLYAITGELVYQTEISGQTGLNQLTWALKNQNLESVASGLYLYVLQVTGPSGLTTSKGQVVVLH